MSKSKAIQKALGQLGWHASAKDIVALLASYGIEVDEGLVHKVKMERLKDTARLKRQQAKVQRAPPRPAAPFRRKVPPGRSYRR